MFSRQKKSKDSLLLKSGKSFKIKQAGIHLNDGNKKSFHKFHGEPVLA
jgi:hypothetical protein